MFNVFPILAAYVDMWTPVGCVCVYVCTFVCLLPGHMVWIGPATRCSEDYQSVVGMSCVRSDCGHSQGQVHVLSFDSWL